MRPLKALGATSPYLVGLVLCLAVFAWSYRLRAPADLRLPLSYSRDTLGVLALIKGQTENAWYLVNERLGAPGHYDMHDYPVTDLLPLLLLKLLGLLSANPVVVFHLFVLLTYPLTTLTALAVLRHFGIGRVPAVGASLLYTFLPFHQGRVDEGHLFLTAYYLVPPVVMVIVWICQGRRLLFRANPQTGLYRLHLTSPAAIVTLGICLLTAVGNVYFAFFACFLLMVAGAAVLLRERNVLAGLSALCLVALITGGVVLAGLPTLLYRAEHGTNPETGRDAVEADMFSLKVAHLVLPIREHRVPALARIRAAYSHPWRPLENENNYASLGAVGAGGFLLLLGCLLLRAEALPESLASLRLLNLAAVLLGVIGGLGSLVSFLVIPEIRCYNRISVYIAFFALWAGAWAANALFFTPGRSRWVKALGLAIVPLVTLAGLLDQTPRALVPNRAQLAAALHSDADFFGRVEATLPRGAMVFQLPYTRFPEWAARHQMGDYEHFRAYLHSRALRWSYGAMANREADAWQKHTAGLPTPRMVEALALTGFGGLYVDRRGYPAERLLELEAQLRGCLGDPPLVSADGQRSCYDLSAYAARLKEKSTPSEWEEARAKAIAVPCALYQEGFFRNPTVEGPAPRWCRRNGVLTLVNPGDRPRAMELALCCRTEGGAPSFPLRIESALFTHAGTITAGTEVRAFRFTLPPGRHPVRFSAHPPGGYIPSLPEHIFYLTIESFREVEGPPGASRAGCANGFW